MDYVLNILVLIASFLAMEFVAWNAHKYIMHGFLWRWHKDHHRPDLKTFFQKNDYFFLVFAAPGITSLVIGLFMSKSMLVMVGAGISIYGMTYFLIHDVFIHRRLKWLRNSNSKYLKAVRRVHKLHHKNLGKEGGECFGLLWIPLKYFKS
ncbi:sterol desaturase family protein [Flavobacteriales bacterium]|jgi:beta-carotene 3-hydroxylase|nr:sterol desaturase family protein [Flavobacteriales bacterium]